MNPDYLNVPRYATVLTNGVDELEIQCSRHTCSVDPPPGMEFTVLNGAYFINGKPAWVQVREI